MTPPLLVTRREIDDGGYGEPYEDRLEATLLRAVELLEAHSRFCMCRRRFDDDDIGCDGRTFLAAFNERTS